MVLLGSLKGALKFVLGAEGTFVIKMYLKYLFTVLGRPCLPMQML